MHRGRKGLSPSLPSEPCRRFSRTLCVGTHMSLSRLNHWWKCNKKVALKPWLRRLTGTHLAMALVARFANRSDLLEVGEE
jgi:hypothetical protein